MFDKSRSHPVSADQEELASAFLAVRRAIGLSGLSLPIMLYAYARVAPGGNMQPSISEFYHTAMGDVLVGALVAIGIFLIAYVGHKPNRGDKLTDWWVSTIAGAGAIGVAIFPASPPLMECTLFQKPEIVQGVTTHWCQCWYPVHYICAAIFFICMAIFCLFLFPKNKKGEIHYFDEPGNSTYLACGVALIISIAGLLVYLLLGQSDLGRWLGRRNFVFWFETLGVVAFAIAWLTKGNLAGGVAALVKGKPAVSDDQK